MGASGPIPWTAIDAYARRKGFAGDGFEYLVKMVRAMDDVFLRHLQDKREQEREEN